MIASTHLLGFLTIIVLVIEAQTQCQSATKCECFFSATSLKSSSSSFSPVFSANQSALDNSFNSTTFNGTETIHNGGSWQPSVNDTSPYFTMDFGSDKTIRKIVTKGNAYFNSWVKSYNVYRKTDTGSVFIFYKKLSGNTDGNSERHNSLNPNFRARYVKIVPLTFNNNISLRIDIQGCDKVDGGWTSWEPWRKCRKPCGFGVQYRYRSCENPVPRFLGNGCDGSNYDAQGCNNHTCPDADMTLDLLLPSEIWNNDLLTSPSTSEVCINLKSNLSEVYQPVNIDPFLLVVDCSFFQINTTTVGVLANLTFNTSDALYILKLQDSLYYHQRIHIMPAILRDFISHLVPYPPNILSYASGEYKTFNVKRSAATTGPSTYSFEMFYRLETTNPDGEYSFIDSSAPTGSCDFSSSLCYAWGTKPFHNYTVRIIPFNEEGFGFATNPYRVTTKEYTPSRPSNLNGAMNSSKSINIYWSPVPLINMNGNSKGYQVRYRRSDNSNWRDIRVLDHWTTNLQISGLDEYVEYRIKIKSMNTIYSSGYTSEIRIRTDEDIPTSPPINVAVTASSSTSLRMTWSQVPKADKNGIIINYKINASIGMFITSASSFLLTVNNGNALSAEIPGLVKWSYYTMEIAASTIKGVSVYSPTVTQRTSQDRPDAAPGNLRGNATSSTEIHLLWDIIPFSLRHGILTQYQIKFYPVSNPANIGNAYFNGEGTLEGTITGLLFWSDYYIDIAARTAVGYGPRSAKIMIRTQEHPPTQSPENIRGMNTSSFSLRIEWNDVANLYRHGVILGYKIQYTSTEDVVWHTIVNDGINNKTVDIHGLTNYTIYDIRVSAFNSKGNGAVGSIQVRTEEARPSQPPSSLLSYNTSSSSLWVEWTRVPTISQRGTILGYFVIYHDIVYNITKELTLYGEDTMSFNLTGLDEFREYKISVAGMNKMGIGPFISTKAITDEDVPSAAPTNISGVFISSTGIQLSWSEPPAQDQNGQLMAINVFYKIHIQIAQTRALNGLQYLQLIQSSKGINSTKELRRRRSISVPRKFRFCDTVYHLNDQHHSICNENHNSFDNKDLAINNEIYNSIGLALAFEHEAGHNDKNLPRERSRREVTDTTGYNSVVINANESSVALHSLIPFMNYTVLLQVTTNKGSGPLSNPILVQTGEDVPSAPPQNISTAFTSSTSIVARWLPVPSVDANGVIYAYTVSCKRTNSTDEWMNYTQYEPNLSYEFTGLMKFVVYSIKVRAITKKGSGPFSEAVYQRSDEDIPSGSPDKLDGEAISSTGLFVKWRPVPENGEPSCCLHGILTGYKVFYGKKYPAPGDVIKTEFLPASQLSLNILNLEIYTPYTIGVSAITVKGSGPISRIHIWTLGERPTLAPQNETVRNKTSTSLLIEWNELPYMERKGEIRGYAVYYRITKSSHPLSVKWLDMYHFTANYTIIYEPPKQAENDDTIRRLWYELKGLYKFMEYTIHLTSYNKKGIGPWTYAKFSMTDEDVPSKAATNITGHFVNSTAILVSWDPIPVVYDPSIEDPICCVHGNLTGYTIFYSRVTKERIHNVTIDISYFEKHKMLRNETNHTIPFNQTNITQSSKMHFTLIGLDSHKNYTIYVVGNTKKGHGVWGEPIYVQTDEDVPAREPSGIRAWNISSTSIGIEWDHIIWEYRNGIILYYTIYYRETQKPWQQEQALNVSVESNSTVLRNLRKWTFYDIKIYGATVKGQGLFSANVTVRTDSDVPTMSPLSFTAIDYTGPYSLFIKWKPIPVEHRHGVILSYKILYFKYSEADVIQQKGEIYEKIVSEDNLGTYLEYLSTFCTYEIKILGITDKGDGVSSQPIRARTCRCVKHLYTNWWQLPPYTIKTANDGTNRNIGGVSDPSYVPMGLFPTFLRDMAIWACQNCNGPRGHGLSVVHFDIESNGQQSLKDSKYDCMKNVNEFVDFTFPVQGDTFKYKFISDGIYLEFINHPSSAFIVLKKLKIVSKSEAVKTSIFTLWPIFLINLELAMVSGLIYWFLDHNSNPEELPQSIITGGMNGIWWAYVTMTTVGYGDITPRSIAAKIFSIIWMLTGLVLFAILGSGLITALSAQEAIIMQPIKLYNNRIAVVNGSFEERLAMIKSARPVAKNTINEVLEMVKHGEIDAALIDTFQLSSYNNYFEASPLFVQQTIRTSSFNYGIGLYGNITKLRNAFTDYIHSNQEQLVAIMSQYIAVKEKGESAATTQDESSESPGLFQPSSPIYKQTLYILSMMIGSFAVLGIITMVVIFKIKQSNRRLEVELEQLRNSSPEYKACEGLFEEVDTALNNFVQELERKLQDLNQKHKCENEWLIHLHKFINRCRKELMDPIPYLKRHDISIRYWKRLYREGDMLKSQMQTANNFAKWLERKRVKKSPERRYKTSKDWSDLPQLSERNDTSHFYLGTGTQSSQNLADWTDA